jgi:N-carbamoylputrescine amidase
MSNITVAAIQTALSPDLAANIKRMDTWIREAAAQGGQVILPSELFAGHYFCREEQEAFFGLAHPVAEHAMLTHFQALAAELGVVLPISFFEKAGPAYYNSIAIIDADGKNLGTYRKSHIPDGPGYEEKFYFRPGDTGFKVWSTRYGTIGVGICWDQWFPECARAMTLMGADILFYPTAIGSEPQDPDLNTKDPWQRVMIGHAVANVIPIVAANRIGNEGGQVFYGHSFIADHQGEKVTELGSEQEGLLVASFDLALIERTRAAYGFFRDRRPELYSVLLSGDGHLR